MSTLPLDYCRCLGEEGDYVCSVRDSCLRYLAAKSGSNGERVPYAQCLRDVGDPMCTYKIEREK